MPKVYLVTVCFWSPADGEKVISGGVKPCNTLTESIQPQRATYGKQQRALHRADGSLNGLKRPEVRDSDDETISQPTAKRRKVEHSSQANIQHADLLMDDIQDDDELSGPSQGPLLGDLANGFKTSKLSQAAIAKFIRPPSWGQEGHPGLGSNREHHSVQKMMNSDNYAKSNSRRPKLWKSSTGNSDGRAQTKAARDDGEQDSRGTSRRSSSDGYQGTSKRPNVPHVYDDLMVKRRKGSNDSTITNGLFNKNAEPPASKLRRSLAEGTAKTPVEVLDSPPAMKVYRSPNAPRLASSDQRGSSPDVLIKEGGMRSTCPAKQASSVAQSFGQPKPGNDGLEPSNIPHTKLQTARRLGTKDAPPKPQHGPYALKRFICNDIQIVTETGGKDSNLQLVWRHTTSVLTIRHNGRRS